ncbi:MAG: OmpP1/FadL family transporter [Tannerellaceae bacterium]
MKRLAIVCASTLLIAGDAWAQGEMDAYRYSQTEVTGTARSMSMGGAFGALGGDISSIAINPAGMAVFRKSEVATTLSLSGIKTNSNLNGNKMSADKVKFNFDNIGYVGYFPTANDHGLINWNVGFTYNRVKNFERKYRAGGNGMKTSLSDYIAFKADGIKQNDLAETETYLPYDNPNLGGSWLPILGYDAYIIEGNSDSPDERFYSGIFPQDVLPNSSLFIQERGGIDEYDFAFSGNISNFLSVGASFSIYDLDYKMSSKYDEKFPTLGNKTGMYLDNELHTEGTGYGFKIGAIVNPVEFFRVGVAYHSPVWYNMTDRYIGYAGVIDVPGFSKNYDSATPDGAYTDYNLRTPDKWVFSAAAIFGKSALLSVDYEISDYSKMNLQAPNGLEYGDNEFIEQDFKTARTLRIGAEVKVTPQFAVRAGGAFRNSPMKTQLKEGSIEVLTAGTVPNYTVDKGMSMYTFGFGYRFTPSFYVDAACVLKQHKEDVHFFSNYSWENSDGTTGEAITPAASMKTKTTNVLLTFGYKF